MSTRIEEYDEKSTPVDGDFLIISDSQDQNVATTFNFLKKLTIANLVTKCLSIFSSPGTIESDIDQLQSDVLSVGNYSEGLFANGVFNPIDNNMIDQYRKTGDTASNAEVMIDGWKCTEDQTNNPVFTKGPDYIQLQANASPTSPGKIFFFHTIEEYQPYRGLSVTFTCKLVTDNANVRIAIYDGVGFSNSAVVTTADGSTENTMTVTRTIDASATTIQLSIGMQGDDNATTTIAASDVFRFKEAVFTTSVNTSYKPRPLALNKIIAKRQYEKSYKDDVKVGSNTLDGAYEFRLIQSTSTTVTHRAFIPFKVEKRTNTYTVTFWANDATSGQWDILGTKATPTVVTKSTTGFKVEVASGATSSTDWDINGHWEVKDEL